MTKTKTEYEAFMTQGKEAGFTEEQLKFMYFWVKLDRMGNHYDQD